MWQKNKSKYHLLLNYSNETRDGSFCQVACGDQLQSKKKKQSVFLPRGEECPICKGVWHLAFTSTADAMITLKNETNIKVLNQAAIITKSTTLLKAINARIRKIEKDAVKERKLRLTQQAYD